jgi:hypothetical protein
MCLGPCPVYKVAIDHAGLVTFTGSNSNIGPNVPCQGVRQWRIEPAKVRHLEALLDRSGFFGLKPQYSAGITNRPTPSPSPAAARPSACRTTSARWSACRRR